MPISQQQRSELEEKITVLLDTELKPLLDAKNLSEAEIGTIKAVIIKIIKMKNTEIAALWLEKLMDVRAYTLSEFTEQLELMNRISFSNEEKATDNDRIHFYHLADWITQLKKPTSTRLNNSTIKLKSASRVKILSAIKKILSSSNDALKEYPATTEEKEQRELFNNQLAAISYIAVPWYIKKDMQVYEARLEELKSIQHSQDSKSDEVEANRKLEEITDEIEKINQTIHKVKIILSERLLYFSKHGFPLQVQELLENGADPNYVDEKSNLSVLEYAILDASDKVFDVLMTHNNIDLSQKNKAHETPLEMAIKFNKSSKAIKLIEHKAPLEDGLLVLALRQKPPSDKIIDSLLKQDVNLSAAKDETKETVLELAILNGQLSTVKMLVEKKAAVNEITSNGETPLTLAMKSGKEDVVDFLLENGAKAGLKNSYQETPLELAIQSKNPGMVKKLLEKRADVNLITSEGDTPLTLAIKNGTAANSKEIINLLIRHRADPAKKNNSNETPLQHATEYLLSIEDSIKLFLEGREFSPAFASDLNKRAKDGIPLFHHISEIRGDINNLQKNGSFTNWLIENFCADPFIRHSKTLTSDLARYLYPGRTPYQHIIVLLDKGWPLESLVYTLKDASDELFSALILYAAKQNRIDILHSIFTNATDERIKTLNNSTIEEIKQCIAKNQLLPINYINFIENKLKIQKSELSIHQEDYTELLKAVNIDANYLKKLDEIAQRNPLQNLNVKLQDGRSLLDYVYSQTTGFNISANFEHDRKSGNVEKKDTFTVEELQFFKILEHSDASILSINNQSMLHIAILNNAPPSDLLLFILKGANPNTRDAAVKKPADYLASEIKKLEDILLSEYKDDKQYPTNQAFLNDLLKKHKDNELYDFRDDYKKTIEDYNLCIIKKTILEKGYDYLLNPENNAELEKMGISIDQLHSHHLNAYQQCFRKALESHINRKDINGDTLLHKYLLQNNTDQATKLLDLDVDTNIKNDKGNTALHLALINKNNSMAALLLEKGAAVSIANNDHSTALHLAAKNNDLEMMQLILNRNPNLNARDKHGNTVLHIAVRNNNIDMINMIVGYRNAEDKNSLIDINQQNNLGETALYSASLGNSKEMVELLLNNEADPNIPESKNDTPLKMAIKNKNKDSAELLLERKANPNHLNHDGYCAFDVALEDYDENKDIINKMLTDKKIDSTTLDRNLLRAASRYNPYLTNLLMNNGANPHSRDTEGNTVLDRAVSADPLNMEYALDNQDAVLSILLNTPSTTITIIDAPKEKAQKQEKHLHKIMRRAIDNQNYNILEKILEKGANPNVKYADENKKYFSLLHAAAQKNDPVLVKMLLKNGADPNIQSKHDSTALHFTNNPAIAIILLEHDANPNIGYHPINRNLAEQNDKTLIETLLRRGAYPRSWSFSVFKKHFYQTTSKEHLNYLLKKYPLEELPFYLKKTAYPELVKALTGHVITQKRADVLISIIELCTLEQLAFLKNNTGLVNNICTCLKDDALISPANKLAALGKLKPLSTQPQLVKAEQDISKPVVASTATGRHHLFYNKKTDIHKNTVRRDLLDAISADNFLEIKRLLSNTHQVNIKDDEGRALFDIFYSRIRQNQVTPLELENSNPVDESKNPNQRYLALNRETFAILLGKMDINSRTAHNQTLLHLAVIKQAPIYDFIIFVLKGANVNAIDAEGKKSVDYLKGDLQEQKELEDLLTQGIHYLFKPDGLTFLNTMVQSLIEKTSERPKERQSKYEFLKEAFDHQKGISPGDKKAALDIVERLSNQQSQPGFTLR